MLIVLSICANFTEGSKNSFYAISYAFLHNFMVYGTTICDILFQKLNNKLCSLPYEKH